MTSRTRILTLVGAASVALAFTATAQAASSACTVVKMGEPAWTDIRITDALAGTVLDSIGYQQKIQHLSVPIIYQALKNHQIDVFLGNWLPAQQHFVDQYKGGFERLGTNLSGAKFTLAVPDYVAAAGVHSMADLNKYASKFSSTVYGIGPGAPGNQNITKMIAADAYNLKGWKLVASSEAGMLSQVSRATSRHKWIVFLAWEPNPMNVDYHLTYLTGGAKYFGPNYGEATVYTLGRPGFSQQCPNLAHFFGQLAYNVPMENALMVPVTKNNANPKQVAADYLKKHPELLKTWLNGVTTASGQPAFPAAEKALGIQ